jgi:hypothetical protein
MVRRGSTVRVRQRALKSPQSGIFVACSDTTEHLPVKEVLGDRAGSESLEEPLEQERVEAIKGEMRRLLERGSKGKRHRLTRGLANNLLKLGPRSGPSPPSPTSSQQTTPPNADCAPPSSTASSHSAANPKAANARSNASSRRPNLSAPTALALRLPQRHAHRESTRRPHPRPRLSNRVPRPPPESSTPGSIPATRRPTSD